MTTETAPDPTIEAWSDRLEEDLVTAGMDEPQAQAYRYAFELGLTRVISQTATRQELQDGLAANRQELKDGLAANRQELKDGLAANRQELKDALADFRREMDRRFAEVNARFDRMERRFLLWGGGIFGLLVALVVRAFA